MAGVQEAVTELVCSIIPHIKAPSLFLDTVNMSKEPLPDDRVLSVTFPAPKLLCVEVLANRFTNCMFEVNFDSLL